MKRMLSRSLVLSLCLLLSLPAVADAFIFGRSAPKFAITLSVDNAKPGSVIATVTDARGNPAPGQNVAFTWQVRGEPGGPQPGPITATNAIGQTTYIQENWSVVGSIITVTAILQSDPSITATADIAARFIRLRLSCKATPR